jgi:hypothetical protein
MKKKKAYMPGLYPAVLHAFLFSAIVSAMTFPGNDWVRKTPESQGVNADTLQKALDI